MFSGKVWLHDFNGKGNEKRAEYYRLLTTSFSCPSLFRTVNV